MVIGVSYLPSGSIVAAGAAGLSADVAADAAGDAVSLELLLLLLQAVVKTITNAIQIIANDLNFEIFFTDIPLKKVFIEHARKSINKV